MDNKPSREDRLTWQRSKATQAFQEMIQGSLSETRSSLETCSPNDLGRLQGLAQAYGSLLEGGILFERFLKEGYKP